MSRFKVGDKVKLVTSEYVDNKARYGDVGVVKDSDTGLVGVEFATPIIGHDLHGALENENGLYICESSLELTDVQESSIATPTKTGGSTPNQYRLSINLPLTSDRTQFVDVDLEAMDVIDALDLSGNLKDVQKALFRMGKKQDTPLAYDLNKCLFYILREMKKRDTISHAKFWEVSETLEKILKAGDVK